MTAMVGTRPVSSSMDASRFMARTARVVVPHLPYHVTQRGNHRSEIFFSRSDKVLYLSLLKKYSQKFKMQIWAYCLMPNHVHLLVLGEGETSMSRAVGNAHCQYSRIINNRQDVTGHLWANRFDSSALDEHHLWAAGRYIELNPVRAGMVRAATDYEWSSARAHAGLCGDDLLSDRRPFPGWVADWQAWLEAGLTDEELSRLRINTRRGRPPGSKSFVIDLEVKLSRKLRPERRGPRPKKRD